MSRSRNQHCCGRNCPVCNESERAHAKNILRKAPIIETDYDEAALDLDAMLRRESDDSLYCHHYGPCEACKAADYARMSGLMASEECLDLATLQGLRGEDA